jgi:transcriptional regulator with XRE-family HTH domain
MAFQLDPELIGSNIRYYREKQSLTIRRLADLSLLRYQQIADMENGVGMPSVRLLAVVAEVLGVQAYQLTLPRPPEAEYQEGC